jgi:glycosyltransferase involved in cell wall biosynthesis
MRLGIYADLVYRRDGPTLSTDLSFILFATALAGHVDEVVLFGRLHPAASRAPYVLPGEGDGVRFVPLPHYDRVTSLSGMARAFAATRRRFADELDRLDAVWIFGPHPIALELVRVARRRGTPVFLGIRQQFPRYVSERLPSRRWLLAVPAVHMLERAFRLLSRKLPTVVVGEELARHYGGGRAPTLATGFSLVRADDVVHPDAALSRRWDGELRLLTVGRLEAEKNPMLLPDILAGLLARYGGWRLAVAGDGPLRQALGSRAAALGVAPALELLGYVPYGPPLAAEYRRSQAFLHVSLTEGVPQVLFEAQAAGLPIVATAVGGVPAALRDGALGLLVPPRDPGAAVEALERVRRDERLREALVRAALENAMTETLDAQLDRVSAFLHRGLGP